MSTSSCDAFSSFLRLDVAFAALYLLIFLILLPLLAVRLANSRRHFGDPSLSSSSPLSPQKISRHAVLVSLLLNAVACLLRVIYLCLSACHNNSSARISYNNHLQLSSLWLASCADWILVALVLLPVWVRLRLMRQSSSLSSSFSSSSSSLSKPTAATPGLNLLPLLAAVFWVALLALVNLCWLATESALVDALFSPLASPSPLSSSSNGNGSNNGSSGSSDHDGELITTTTVSPRLVGASQDLSLAYALMAVVGVVVVVAALFLGVDRKPKVGGFSMIIIIIIITVVVIVISSYYKPPPQCIHACAATDPASTASTGCCCSASRRWP